MYKRGKESSGRKATKLMTINDADGGSAACRGVRYDVPQRSISRHKPRKAECKLADRRVEGKRDTDLSHTNGGKYTTMYYESTTMAVKL